MTTIKNKSNDFDATHVSTIIRNDEFQSSSSTTNVLLYGDYIVDDNGIGRYSKFFVFNGYDRCSLFFFIESSNFFYKISHFNL